MDTVISANKNSVILLSLEDAFVTSLAYGTDINYPNLSKQIVKMSPNVTPSGDFAGKTVEFDLLRVGFLDRLVVQHDITWGATQTSVSANLGAMICAEQSLRVNNKTIVSNSDAYVLCRIQDEPFEKSVAYKKLIQPTDEVTGVVQAGPLVNTDITRTHSPFFSNFTDKVQNAIDLTFVQKLTFRIVYNTYQNMGIYGTSGHSVEPKLWMWYHNLDMKDYAELSTANFPVNGNLSMLSYSDYVETGNIGSTTATSTSSIIELRNKNTVFKTHIFLKDNRIDTLSVLRPINNITLKLSGRCHFEEVPRLIMNLDADLQGSGNIKVVGTVVTADQQSVPIVIPWCMVNDRSYQSGAVCLSNVNTPMLTLNYPSITGNATDYYVVHEAFQVVSISSSGEIVVSTAS